MTDSRPSSEPLSFIIPVLNGSRYIGQCLERIFAEKRPEDEVIIVDNGSTDNTLEIVGQFPVTQVLQHPGITIAALRNRGAAVAKNDIFAFIDSDCLLSPGWRDAVDDAFRRYDAAAVGSHYDLPPNPTWVERAWSYPLEKEERPACYLPSSNFVVKRAPFTQVSGFDEKLVTDEDSMIGRALRQAGYEIMYIPRIRIVHLANPKTMKDFIKKEVWHAVSLIDGLRRHGMDRPMLMTFAFIITVLLALVSVPLARTLEVSPLWFVASLILVPLITAAYRVARHGNARCLPHLVLLYFLFYLLRSYRLLTGIWAKTQTHSNCS